MSTLIAAETLAAEWGIELDRFHRMRREKKWPCVKLGRNDVRFTPEQVDQIITMQSVAGGSRSTGQTPLSAARGKSA